MADAKNILSGQLKGYRLCKQCLERHGSRQKPGEPCYICRGLMGKQDSIVRAILAAGRKYQFDTFLIGAVLPTQIYEREDAMRARLKIRGRESAKSQLTREVGLRFSKATRKKVDYLNPDLTVNIAVDRDNNVEVATRSRPLAFEGRYVKEIPGMPQKQERCGSCGGKGCDACDYSGLSGYDSIEGMLAKEIMRRTGGKIPKFSWVGSEDRSSLVLGNGRPFYAKVSDPRRRKLRRITARFDSVAAKLTPIEDSAKPQVGFSVKTRITVRCERAIDKKDLKKIAALGGAEVKFESRSKIAAKKIHTAAAKRIDERTFDLTIVADGGLMIKQFVGGEEYMKPNISEMLGSKCECLTFDILDVQLQSQASARA